MNDLLNPQVVIEVVQYIPPLWFVFLMTGVSFAFLAFSFLMRDRTGFIYMVSSSVFVATASAPYVWGFSPYAMVGYLLTLILVMTSYIVREFLHSRYPNDERLSL